MARLNFRLIYEEAKFHWNIIVRGIGRMLYGTLIAILFAVAIYGFVVTRSETGYIAVCDFIASFCTLNIAICNVYLMGGKKGGKK
jgi:hypothetical protein